MNNIEEQKKMEAETLCYKQFMKIAKRVQQLQYGKWQIVPSMEDPLRKFTLEKDIGWATVQVSLYMDQTYHRGVYSSDRYFYIGKLKISGLTKTYNNNSEHILLGQKIKPRMASKIITHIDDVVTPAFYAMINDYRTQQMDIATKEQQFKDRVALVPGLTIKKDIHSYYNEHGGILKNCPFRITISNQTTVKLVQDMTFEMFAEYARQYGWGTK
jgi:hypothetical protein